MKRKAPQDVNPQNPSKRQGLTGFKGAAVKKREFLNLETCTREEIIVEINKNDCRILQQEGVHGKVYRICEFISPCGNCYAIKIGDIEREEYEINQQAYQVLQGTRGEGCVAKPVRYISSTTAGYPNNAIMIMQFIQSPIQTENFFKSSTPEIFLLVQIQLFKVLNILSQKIPGFLHMDLKFDNLKIIEGLDTEEYLELDINAHTKVSLRIPPHTPRVVLLDFGISVKKIHGSYSSGIFDIPPFNRECYHEYFDVVRWLSNLRYPKMMDFRFFVGLNMFGKTQSLFPNWFFKPQSYIEHLFTQKKYFDVHVGMLTGLGCVIAPRLLNKTKLGYKAFLQNCIIYGNTKKLFHPLIKFADGQVKTLDTYLVDQTIE